MGCYAPLSDCVFSASDSFKDSHALLHELIGLNVQQIGAWQTVLGNEDWFFVPLNVREEFSGLALEGRDEFGTHRVTLQCHFELRKWLVQRPNA